MTSAQNWLMFAIVATVYMPQWASVLSWLMFAYCVLVNLEVP
jgi:hypothetical protein